MESAVNEVNRKANINAMSLSFIFLPAIEFLGILATAIVLWFGGRAVGSGTVTLGVLVAFLSYVTHFFRARKICSVVCNPALAAG